MAKIYKSDLSNINESSALIKISTMIENAKKNATQIKFFNDSSVAYLSGAGYDMVRKKMGIYADALNKQALICTNLVGNIKSANNAMLNYMEEYDVLDDSQVPEISQKLNEAKNLLAELKSQLKNAKSSQLVSINLSIAECESTIEELSRFLDKLKGLSSAVSSAYAIISDVINDVRNYNSALARLEPTLYDGIKSV